MTQGAEQNGQAESAAFAAARARFEAAVARVERALAARAAAAPAAARPIGDGADAAAAAGPPGPAGPRFGAEIAALKSEVARLREGRAAGLSAQADALERVDAMMRALGAALDRDAAAEAADGAGAEGPGAATGCEKGAG